jgi:rod shape-determining protein MreD
MSLNRLNPKANKDPLIAIIVSVIIASVLIVYPLSYDASGWRPEYMLLVVMFWVLCQPTWCGVWFAFAMGMFLDLLVGSPLGLNALSFVIITFVTRFLIREKRILTFLHIWIIVSLSSVVHLLLQWLMQVMGGLDFALARHWQSLPMTIFVFPIIYAVLKRWRI